MSPDWAEKPEAVPYSKLENPQSLNLSQYVGNNPLSKADTDGHCYPACTVAIGAAAGFIAGAGAEYIGEKLKGESVDSSRILHTGEGGAIAGAIAWLAGPEAGAIVKLGTSVGGQLVGGAAERGLNGEQVLAPKEMAKNAVADAIGTKIEDFAEKAFASTALKHNIPPVVGGVTDAARRSLPNPTPDTSSYPAPNPQPPPRPQSQIQQ